MRSFGHHLDIIWTSFGHHLDIIWESFGDHLVLIFGEIKIGGSGGEAPQLSKGVWGGARPRNITGWKNNDFHVVML